MTAAARFHVRPVELDDAESISALLTPIVARGDLTAMTAADVSVEGQRAFIEKLSPRASYLAAVDTESGAIVGVQDVQPNALEPRVGDVSTFVDLERAREGIGSALMAVSVEHAPATKVEQLQSVIGGSNLDARAFYRAQGFTEHPSSSPSFVVGVRHFEQGDIEATESRPRLLLRVPGRLAQHVERKRPLRPLHASAQVAFAALAFVLTVLASVVALGALNVSSQGWNGFVHALVTTSWFLGIPWLVMALPYILVAGPRSGRVIGSSGVKAVFAMTATWTVLVSVVYVTALLSEPGRSTDWSLEHLVFIIYAGVIGALVGLPTAGGCVLGYGLLWKISDRMSPRDVTSFAWACGLGALAISGLTARAALAL